MLHHPGELPCQCGTQRRCLTSWPIYRQTWGPVGISRARCGHHRIWHSDAKQQIYDCWIGEWLRPSQVRLGWFWNVASVWQTLMTPRSVLLHRRRGNHQSGRHTLLHRSRHLCKSANCLISQVVIPVDTSIAAMPICVPSVGGALSQQWSVQVATDTHHPQRRSSCVINLSWTVCLVFMHFNNVVSW